MKLLPWLPAILWMAIIYTMSSFTASPVSQFHLIEFLFKKSIHMIEYGTLWFFTHRAFMQTTNLAPIKITIYSLLITILYAVTDEFHQTLTPTRNGVFTDVIVDTAGAIIAITLYYKFSRQNNYVHPKIHPHH